jgi:hypothetical protein
MNLSELSIEDLAALRNKVISTPAEKARPRQKKLLAESERGGRSSRQNPSINSSGWWNRRNWHPGRVDCRWAECRDFAKRRS